MRVLRHLVIALALALGVALAMQTAASALVEKMDLNGLTAFRMR